MQDELKTSNLEKENNYKKGIYFFHSFHLIAFSNLSDIDISSFIRAKFSLALFKVSVYHYISPFIIIASSSAPYAS